MIQIVSKNGEVVFEDMNYEKFLSWYENEYIESDLELSKLKFRYLPGENKSKLEIAIQTLDNMTIDNVYSVSDIISELAVLSEDDLLKYLFLINHVGYYIDYSIFEAINEVTMVKEIYSMEEFARVVIYEEDLCQTYFYPVPDEWQLHHKMHNVFLAYLV